MKKIGFIGGGNMAEALIAGLLNTGTLKATRLFVSEPNAARRRHLAKKYRVRCVSKNAPLLAKSDLIVLAVKPQVIPQVLAEIAPSLRRTHCVISIAAGIDTKLIKKYLGRQIRLIRAMPNTPALVSQGVTGLYATNAARAADRKEARSLFAAVGEVVFFSREQALDWVTAVSGSGPAYVFRFMEAMIAAARKGGISQAAAEQLSFGTVAGAVALASSSKSPLEMLRKRVTSKGGTTEAALKSLQQDKWSQALERAIRAAARRAKELRSS